MGTIIKVIVGAFVLLVVGCAAVLFFAHQAGSNAQEAFYDAVHAGDVAKVKARFHPDLAAKIDEPVLEAWMKAVNERLGAFTGMSASHFNMSVKQGADGEEVTSEGIAEFEKGTAKSKLKLVDDKIIAWSVESDVLAGDWFSSLEDPSFYDAKARVFLEAVMAGEADKAWALMHDNLQKNVGEQKWTPMVAAVQSRYSGAALELDRHEFKAGPPPEVVLFYRVKGTEDATITVRFQFKSWQGHLIGFDFAP